MHDEVVKEEVGDVDRAVGVGDEKKQREREDVRRVEPAQASFPEWTKANVGLDSGRARFGPLQVNAKTRNDEEQENPDVAKRADELERPNRVSEEVIRQGVVALLDRVMTDEGERRDSAQRVHAAQA